MNIDKIISHSLSHKRPKTRCWLWHSWGRWEDQESYQVTRGPEKRLVGTGIRQERRCQDCHMLEMRKIESLID